ncbi:hypothetical protein E2C01_096021 [Portunus trituberculatus]|uniref:Uncharacterized protein n=1 Tax=Portunus trituberculatus TaxID=210409 RepID=A0A5B7K763_PORTR|nr:hypothetical protein [Portunus trituberculatus]
MDMIRTRALGDLADPKAGMVPLYHSGLRVSRHAVKPRGSKENLATAAVWKPPRFQTAVCERFHKLSLKMLLRDSNRAVQTALCEQGLKDMNNTYYR